MAEFDAAKSPRIPRAQASATPGVTATGRDGAPRSPASITPRPAASSETNGRVKTEDLPDHFRARLDAFRRRTGRSASTGDTRSFAPAHVVAAQVTDEIDGTLEAAGSDEHEGQDASSLLDELSAPPPAAGTSGIVAAPALSRPSASIDEGIAEDTHARASSHDGAPNELDSQAISPAVSLEGEPGSSSASTLELDPRDDGSRTPTSTNAALEMPTARSRTDAALETDSGSIVIEFPTASPAVVVVPPLPPIATQTDQILEAMEAQDMLVGLDAPLLIQLPLTSRQPASIDSIDEPAPRSDQPLSDEPVVLDPGGADIPATPPRATPRPVPPQLTAMFGLVFGFAAIASVLALLIQLDPTNRPFAAMSPSGSSKMKAAPSASVSSAPVTPAVEAPKEPVGPPVWRVAQMADEDGVKLIEGKPGQKSLVDALTDENIPKAQVFRLLKSFDDSKRFDHPRKNDAYVVALDKPTKRIRAFEYKVSSTEIYQARESDDGKLVGGKLDLHVEQHRVAKAIVVKDDLKSAITEAGLDDDLIGALDDALEGRVQLARVKKGATLRVIAQEQTVAGKFAKYVDVEAVEFTGASKDAKPLRIYHFKGKSAGHYDASGKAPYSGGPWRYPLQNPRITSKFNPNRMHPVLHTVMPHNGCDFGAAVGTPIYAASAGTIAQIGPSGPSGNLIILDHGGGLTTGYAHQSKFVPGLKVGDKVDVHQHIGYVGTTGRSTGPHLHFSLKRNGQFVDPLSMKMDGERVIPKAERDDFDALKSELDKLLDGMPLPERDSSGGDPSGPDDDNDEDNHDGTPEKASDDGAKEGREGREERDTNSASDGKKDTKKDGKKDGKKDASGDGKPETPGDQNARPVEEGPLDSAIWKPL